MTHTTNPQPIGQVLQHPATRALGRMTDGTENKRAAYDFYPTPPEAVRALLALETFSGPIWEPACGEGAISEELKAAGYDVVSTDLIPRGYGEGGVDFLLAKVARGKTIITNPPYGRGLADRFVAKALALTQKTGGDVAMLLNLASLCHPTRHAGFVKHPPAMIYALDELVCWPNGDETQATKFTNKQRYCWVIWRHGHTGRPAFWWLSVGQFKAGPPSMCGNGGHAHA